MSYGDKPFGISDIKITNIAGSTQVDLPAAQTLTFKERLVSGELRGDGLTLAVASEVDAVEAELEAGGISLEAYALMTGRTVTTSGTTPTAKKTLNSDGGVRLPYIKIYGKSLGDSTDDIHVKFYKCKLVEGLEGSLADGEFLMSSVASIICIDDGSNGIFDIVQNETATTLPTT